MSTHGYKIRDQFAVHFITFATVRWVDVFTRKEYADIVVESLRYCQKEKGLQISAWCIMPNHLHLIISAKGPAGLSALLRDFKKFTSAKIVRAIEMNDRESRKPWMMWLFKSTGEMNSRNKDFQFWQQDNHPIECSTASILQSRMNYLHENPVRAGLVWNPEDYCYSSAVDYCSLRRGLIDIDRRL